MQVIDLSTGSRRDDVTASVGEMCVSKSGRFVVVVDYDRQHAVAVHCLDGLLRQLAEEDLASGDKGRCPGYVEVAKQPDQQVQQPGRSSASCDVARPSSAPSQPESEITIEEFDRRCKRPSPPVCNFLVTCGGVRAVPQPHFYSPGVATCLFYVF